MKREAGFYWVRTVMGWTVAELSPGFEEEFDMWYICGNEDGYRTSELQEIDKKPIPPKS